MTTPTIHPTVPSPTEGNKQNAPLYEAFLNINDFLPMKECITKSDFSVEEIPIEDLGHYQYLVNGSYDINCEGKDDQIYCVLNHNEKSILKVNEASISF